jgi:hypothetical protein
MTRDRHPIEESPPLPLERRVQLLEIHLAQLWDMVWWESLPPDRRAAYEAEGFTAPIQQFYRDESDVD